MKEKILVEPKKIFTKGLLEGKEHVKIKGRLFLKLQMLNAMLGRSK